MNNKIVVLSGGVGGAHFLEGLIQIIPQEEVFVIGNTGDDEQFYGLHVSPDLDIVMYTLAGVVNSTQGWGFQNETYNVMTQLTQLGNDDWFKLGDKDLATQIHRTNLLKEGKTLSEATDTLRKAFGLQIKLSPMSNQVVRTLIKTPRGFLPFQEYFVKNKAQDEVLDIIYSGSEKSHPAPGVLEAIHAAKAIILAPSNPLVSIGTILSIPGVRNALYTTKAKIAAISPIINGTTIKGPADKMMKGMGMEASALGVAEYYRDLLDVMIIDNQDKQLQKAIEKLEIKTVVTDTIMKNSKIKATLAQIALDAANS